jgi:polysaccharide deacetylase 2 family uncharacterized protein YibQ
MSGNGKKGSQQRNRLRTAAILLVAIAAALIAALTMLPPRRTLEVSTGTVPARSVPPEALAERRRSAPAPAEEPGSREHPGGPGQPGGPEHPGARPERPRREASIAVVIDDVGYNLDTLTEFLELPGPLTFAVLPQLQYTREAARLIRAAGKELILHLPMEAVNGDDPGPGAILSSYSDAEIRRLLEENFADLEGAVGANNHMGSKATADPRVMAVVMDYLKQSGRFYLDSRTTPASRAAFAAREAGVDFLERDVFIDNDTDGQSMRVAIDKGVELAQLDGQAVLIGHVKNSEMVGVLQEILADAAARKIRLVSLSELAQEKGRPE